MHYKYSIAIKTLSLALANRQSGGVPWSNMNSKPSPKPYRQLGFKLRSIREQRKESLAEFSGAVEIDTEILEKIEAGEQRPTEDILLLLLSYFNVQDEDATPFWDLAGYGPKQSEQSQQNMFEINQPIAMLMPVDLRVVYTDRVHVMANNYGVVMNFMQTAGPNGQPLAVSRVGMSHEHAKSLLELLQHTLQAQDKTTNKMLKHPKHNSKEAPNDAK